MPASNQPTTAPDKRLALTNVAANDRILSFCRTFVAIVAGLATGLLGVSGWQGFVYYFASQFAVSMVLLGNVSFQAHRYFDSNRAVVTQGLFSGIMSFVLFWTLSYNCTFVY